MFHNNCLVCGQERPLLDTREQMKHIAMCFSGNTSTAPSASTSNFTDLLTKLEFICNLCSPSVLVIAANVDLHYKEKHATPEQPNGCITCGISGELTIQHLTSCMQQTHIQNTLKNINDRVERSALRRAANLSRDEGSTNEIPYDTVLFGSNEDILSNFGVPSPIFSTSSKLRLATDCGVYPWLVRIFREFLPGGISNLRVMPRSMLCHASVFAPGMNVLRDYIARGEITIFPHSCMCTFRHSESDSALHRHVLISFNSKESFAALRRDKSLYSSERRGAIRLTPILTTAHLASCLSYVSSRIKKHFAITIPEFDKNFFSYYSLFRPQGLCEWFEYSIRESRCAISNNLLLSLPYCNVGNNEVSMYFKDICKFLRDYDCNVQLPFIGAMQFRFDSDFYLGENEHLSFKVNSEESGERPFPFLASDIQKVVLTFTKNDIVLPIRRLHEAIFYAQSFIRPLSLPSRKFPVNNSSVKRLKRVWHNMQSLYGEAFCDTGYVCEHFERFMTNFVNMYERKMFVKPAPAEEFVWEISEEYACAEYFESEY